MKQSTYPLVDRLLDGKLADTLIRYRDDGLTFDQMVTSLKADHDLDVSRETFRRWLKKIDEEAQS
jgi:hypothetical protein